MGTCYCYEDGMPASNSREPPNCPGNRCLISSKAHNVSESRPPANCIMHARKLNVKGFPWHAESIQTLVDLYTILIFMKEL